MGDYVYELSWASRVEALRERMGGISLAVVKCMDLPLLFKLFDKTHPLSEEDYGKLVELAETYEREQRGLAEYYATFPEDMP